MRVGRFFGSRFSHSYAVHKCGACEDFSHTSQGSPNWSVPFLVIAAVSAIPLWIALMMPPFEIPWFHGIGIMAGECLIFYVAGFLAGMPCAMLDHHPKECPCCGGAVILAGNYYNTGELPNVEDLFTVLVFVLLNLAVWLIWLPSLG